MPTITKTGTVQSIAPLGNGKYRIILEDNSYTIANLSSGIQLVYGNVNTSSVFLDPYINTPNITYSDYNATLGNATDIRPGTLFQDIDYSSNATFPVNFNQLISGSATKANIPDSNYTSKRSILPRYEGSRVTVNAFNSGESFNDQSSASTYVAYYSSISSSGALAPFKATMTIEYLISPEGELIDMVNNDENAKLLEENFTKNIRTGKGLSGGSNSHPIMNATPFSGSFESTYGELYFDRQIQVLSGSTRLQVKGARGYPPYPDDTQGGLLIPSGIELTSAKNLPQQARTILTEARII